MVEEYECDQCGASFENQSDLEEHGQEAHGKDE